MQLVIANRNYSSWSLRPWLAMKMAGVAFDEVRIALDQPDTGANIRRYSPTGKLPCLVDGALTVWDSLAICEYVNETFLEGRGWPSDPSLRYLARCAAAEMHSGFAPLRAQLPMNCRRTPNAYRWKADAEADIRRFLTLWRELLRRGVGPFLLGDFGIVDAMFAPVAIRFRGYGVVLDDNARHYSEALFALPAMREWQAAAEAETERLGHDAL